MNSVTVLGLVVSAGFLLGELASVVRLPKVMGYIIAGLLLNPSLTPVIPGDFIHHTDIPTSIALSFITFSVGGALSFKKLQRLGRSIIFITIFESQTAFLFTAVGLSIWGWFVTVSSPDAWLHEVVPGAILFGALACPTDPSATLAVTHQYHAKGKVPSTILGVAGLDDIAGLINFTIVSTLALVLTSHLPMNTARLSGQLGTAIGGALLTGALFGGIITFGLRLLQRETEGAQIVVIFASLMLCYGVAKMAGFEELLATMTAGIVVTNFSHYRQKVFSMLERYTDEIIFVFFFTVSAMQLDFKLLSGSLLTVAFFVVFRFLGKVCGTVAGGTFSGEKLRDSFLISLGLIPQGGIVIGLVLTFAGHSHSGQLSDTLLAVIIGATVFHEIVGPLFAALSLRLSGEAPSKSLS